MKKRLVREELTSPRAKEKRESFAADLLGAFFPQHSLARLSFLLEPHRDGPLRPAAGISLPLGPPPRKGVGEIGNSGKVSKKKEKKNSMLFRLAHRHALFLSFSLPLKLQTDRARHGRLLGYRPRDREAVW